jgi:amino acid adenylation domain-containing protein
LDVRLVAIGERLRVNAPKGTLTAELRSQITERKTELLTFLRDQASSASPAPPPIPSRASKESAPLSFAQERLWFLEQLQPGSAVYNICRVSRLTGQLNIAALEASLTEILRRHDILRSQIRVIDGQPMQLTTSAPEFKLHFTDLRSLTGTELDEEVRDQIRSEGERQLDFSAGLFLRALLLQISDDQHILVLTTHHIVSDAWSMGILTRELWAHYQARANGKPLSLQELPVQYADYAVWQREWLQGDVLEAQLSYWRKQLENIPMLNLPTDHPRPAKQSFRGARQPISLPQSLTTAVNELSRHEGVTQFMTLLAAFQVLLHRYCGQEDLVVGSPITNRNRTETEGLIGFFVNALVLRADLSEKPTFKELLQRVRNVCLTAYAHQDLPFEKLVEELRPERDLSRNPLFQVMFVLQNTPRPFQQPSGLSIERVDVLTATSPFDLSLYLRERDGKLIGFFEYNLDLFEPSTIARMIGHFETLLERIVADPGQPISTLPLLTEAERHQLLVEWNDTAADYPKDCCIHELFEAQVERTPEAIAVQFEGKQLTYRELNGLANKLAHQLQSLGIGPEKLVGICIERSIEMVVGLLGILKAGGTYVPLDPAYPKQRLAFMMEDSQVSVLLTSERIVEGLKIMDSNSRSSILDPRLQVVFVDRRWPLIAQQSDKNPLSQVYSTDLAYVIYTSGSTGQPKGVQIEHRSVINCLHSVRQRVELIERDVFLALTTISFDIAALELFLPLTTGAKLVLASRDEALDGRRLLGRLTECGATAMQATPSAWKLLVDAGWNGSKGFQSLCGGEVLSRQLADQLLQGGATLWNLYGPTETTIWSTITEVQPGEDSVPIGRPIANTQIYILDSQLQPVPVGGHGELYIAGDGLARGYLNGQELTGERFIRNPFSDDPNARLYKTGDRAHYRPDGDIEFLGRPDNQVKIRGYRIELGEIEAILTKHPTVKDCVIVVCEHESQIGKNLVGYVVPTEHSVLSVTELRRYLKEKLPAYMIPSSFVVLEVLPLMPNGKVDRNRLPPSDGTRPPLTKEFVLPRTEIEELIAQTWREVLKIENVGIYDNFFELGGHSLLATQIVARLQEALNKDVPLRVLFDAPTIVELAQELETIIRDGHVPKLPPIVPVPRDGPLPLSLNQEHLWRLDRMMPGTHFFNMPYVYRLSGEIIVEPLEKALREIIRRHEVLRTVFEEIDGRPVQIIKDGSDFQLQTLDFRGGSPANVSRAAAEHIVEERSASFDLITGPLIRVKLLRLTEREALLLITMHHIISDHWSMQLFREELIEIYRAEAQGCQSSLPQPKIQYGDYALWERHMLETGQFLDQARYWTSQLFRDDNKNELCVTAETDGEIVRQFHQQTFDINASLLDRVRRFAVQQNCTPFIVLLSAVFVTSYFSFGELEILCGTLLSNRRSRESQGAIGHFLNTVVASARLFPDDTFERIVKKIRSVTLRAHANQEFPFEQLRRQIQNKSGRGPSIRVLFNYQKRSFPATNVAGLTFASYHLPIVISESDSVPATYDLIFDIQETSTSLIGTVNLVNDLYMQRGAQNINATVHKVLNLIVSEPSTLLRDLTRRD